MRGIMTDIITINKSALLFSISAAERVKKICKPLTDYLGITCFGYHRIYNDCSYLSIMNGHEEYHKKHLETIQTQDPHFLDNIREIGYKEPHFFLFPTKYKKLPPIISLHNEFDIWHGFLIGYRHKEYVEMFCFAFNKDSDNKSQFYLQNSQLLVKFSNYFKTQADDLINSKDKKKLAVYQEKFDLSYIEETYKNKQQLFNESISHQNLSFTNKAGNLVHLTTRESDCISILMQNRSMKEIGKLLNLSPRTVECHIENVKQKLEINYKSQLVDIFSNIYMPYMHTKRFDK